MIRSQTMEASGVENDASERLVAILFSTVAILGLAIVAVALIVYFPGTSGLNVPLP